MSKFIFAFAIALLFLSTLSMITNHQGFSVKILITCFWILVIGTLFYFFETINEK